MRPPGWFSKWLKRGCAVGTVMSALVAVTVCLVNPAGVQMGQIGRVHRVPESWILRCVAHDCVVTLSWLTSYTAVADMTFDRRIWKKGEFTWENEAWVRWDQAWKHATWRRLVPRVVIEARKAELTVSPVWFVAAFGASWRLLCVPERRRRWQASGACPRCGYSRAGIAEGAKCPECGEGSASASKTSPE